MRSRVAALALLLSALAACAPQAERIASASQSAAEAKPVWAFERSDIPVDAGYRFGRLDNGMRYVIRQNATPAGTGIVRLDFATGALDEGESEQGFAHFVEHMAFNGSTNVPEGEMVRLLERVGLAFGADTNASTGFDRTTYMLDLPRNDPALLDTALMLMRETASELAFAPEAVEREKGVILAEMRDRNTWQYRNSLADTQFLHPHALYPRRFPAGRTETVSAATADALRRFWQREYVPSQATLIVIGDFDPAMVEARLRERFASWAPSPAEPQPDAGPVDFGDGGRTAVYLDQPLPERITASRHGPWLDERDTIATRQEKLLRQIGYGIINRRLQSLSRGADAPFDAAGFGTGEIFRAGRSTRLIVDTVDGKWKRGLETGALEYRRALKYGFTEAEVAEQVANIRTMARNAAASAATRSHQALAAPIFALIANDAVPSDPAAVLERFERFAPTITPAKVLKALKREALPLDNALLRFRGRRAPEGGEAAIREAWTRAFRAPLGRAEAELTSAFAYSSFGTPGTVATDEREPALGIRALRFANGVRLNLRRTELEKDRVSIKVSIDGGEMLNTRDNPTATEMVRDFTDGGLGKHSTDAMQTILAGRTVRSDFSSEGSTFTMDVRTTPRDLELQLQLLAAYVTDPGYRTEGERDYRHYVNNYFASLRSTPISALRAEIGGILSDNDPRFTLLPVETYRALTFAKLKTDLADRLANGAIEIGIVGDIDEAQAIALVASTFGALPTREAEFRSHDSQPPRPFTANRAPRTVRHDGPSDQALLRFTWFTRDDSDPHETLALSLLERIVRVELTDTLREKLGKAYSPAASSSPSRDWKGYGTFAIAASVAVEELAATRDAILEVVRGLRAAPVDSDVLLRARQPMLEDHDNALKSNAGWLSLVDRAQTEAERIGRYLAAKGRLLALTPLDVLAAAQRYLDPQAGVEITVLPNEPSPKP